MTINVDALTYELACPICGQKIQQTIGWFKTNSPIECPGCHKPITIGTDQLDKAVANMNRQIADLQKTFDDALKGL